jgi:hypothetical protein
MGGDSSSRSSRSSILTVQWNHWQGQSMIYPLSTVKRAICHRHRLSGSSVHSFQLHAVSSIRNVSNPPSSFKSKSRCPRLVDSLADFWEGYISQIPIMSQYRHHKQHGARPLHNHGFVTPVFLGTSLIHPRRCPFACSLPDRRRRAIIDIPPSGCIRSSVCYYGSERTD